MNLGISILPSIFFFLDEAWSTEGSPGAVVLSVPCPKSAIHGCLAGEHWRKALDWGFPGESAGSWSPAAGRPLGLMQGITASKALSLPWDHPSSSTGSHFIFWVLLHWWCCQFQLDLDATWMPYSLEMTAQTRLGLLLLLVWNADSQGLLLFTHW